MIVSLFYKNENGMILGTKATAEPFMIIDRKILYQPEHQLFRVTEINGWSKGRQKSVETVNALLFLSKCPDRSPVRLHGGSKRSGGS